VWAASCELWHLPRWKGNSLAGQRFGGGVTTVIDPPVAAQPSLQPTSRGQRARIVLVLGSLIALGPLTIDMYLPALPVITEDLHSGPTTTQLTLTGTLTGLAFGQLVLGPLSDAVGRRRPLLAGLGLHVVASLLC